MDMIDKAIVRDVDFLLDMGCATEYKEQPLAQDWARVAKVAEELGETISELISYTGQNPRKVRDPGAREKLLQELADTAMTAVYAIQHYTKDINLTTMIMRGAQTKHISRLSVSRREDV